MWVRTETCLPATHLLPRWKWGEEGGERRDASLCIARLNVVPWSRELYSHTFSHIRPTDWRRIDWLANNWLTNLQISDWKTKSYMQPRSQGQEGERPWERGSVTCRLADRWCPVRIAQSQSLMFVNLTNIFTRWNANRSYSLRTAYFIFEAHFKLFLQQFPCVLQLWRFFIKSYQKEWRIKLRIDNGHETECSCK